MKKLLSIFVLFIIALTVSSCSGVDIDDPNTIYVVATAVPHAEILEQARQLLEAQGYTLKVTVVSEYTTPNPAVANGSADANFFQHIPYFDQYNENASSDKQLVNVAGIHIEPLGLYSKSYTSIDQVKDGDTVIISNSTSDHGRFLNVLVGAGLITLKDGVNSLTATLEDIQANPKNLVFEQINPELLFSAYDNDQGELVFINGNFALTGGLNPLSDALILESPENNPYVNIVAVKEGRENLDKIKALVAALTSDTIKTFIEEHYQGTVIPA
ncbi:MAG: MetQ/NlpA family ABC transporter substrate-binding protein [Acholeplasmataceae bacterium]